MLNSLMAAADGDGDVQRIAMVRDRETAESIEFKTQPQNEFQQKYSRYAESPTNRPPHLNP